MTARALRKIEAELIKLAADDEPIAADVVRVAARRIGAQAELIEEGLAE